MLSYKKKTYETKIKQSSYNEATGTSKNRMIKKKNLQNLLPTKLFPISVAYLLRSILTPDRTKPTHSKITSGFLNMALSKDGNKETLNCSDVTQFNRG